MNDVIVIAEAGVNHNGDMSIAKELINVAADAGADFVKFQSFKADKVVSPTAEKAVYQIENTADDSTTQMSMLRKLELSDQDHNVIIECCKKKRIKFLSTAFDIDGLDYLNSFDIEKFKVPSGEITNLPYLRKLSEFGKPVILSTGMASLEEIKSALDVLTQGIAASDIIVLHCNTDYPTNYEDVNLNAMRSIRDSLNVEVGYSDHTLGIEVPIAAIALGARVIEKHFTLDRSLPGPDHKASLEPAELKSMIKFIRNTQLAISGDGIKKASCSEIKNKEIVRKSIHSKKAINENSIITEKDLIPLRPGNGISPMQWDNIIGKRVKRNIKPFELITWDCIK